MMELDRALMCLINTGENVDLKLVFNPQQGEELILCAPL